METTKNKPLASPKEDTLVGNGMSKREARKIRMQSMNKSEIAYMRGGNGCSMRCGRFSGSSFCSDFASSFSIR